MTEHHDPLRDALDQLGETPRDVVPRQALTREQVEAMRALRGKLVTVTMPGEPIYSADGDLIGMTEPTTTSAVMGGLTITAAEADRLGLSQHGGDEDEDEDE